MCRPEQEVHRSQHVARAPKQPTVGRALLSASIQAHSEGRRGSGLVLWGGTCSFPWERMWWGSDRWIPTNRSQLPVAEYLDERAHGLDTWKQLTLVFLSAHDIIRPSGHLISGSFLTPCCRRVRLHLYYTLLLLVGRPHWLRSSFPWAAALLAIEIESEDPPLRVVWREELQLHAASGAPWTLSKLSSVSNTWLHQFNICLLCLSKYRFFKSKATPGLITEGLLGSYQVGP